MGHSSNDFVLRSTDTLGIADAFQDRHYLEACFVDIGLLELLRKQGDDRCIIRGRTGSGKTALLLKLADEEEVVVQIQPDELSLTHLLRTDCTQRLLELDANLDVYFKFLWRHAILSRIFQSDPKCMTSEHQGGFFSRLLGHFNSPQKKKAKDYLEKHQHKFFTESEIHLKEIIETTEQHFIADLGTDLKAIDAKVGSDLKGSKKLISEVVKKAEQIISADFARDLGSVMEVAEAFLTEENRCVYVTIDRLDESFVEDELQIRLIRTLVDTCKDFSHLPNVKLLISMRQDLFERVLSDARKARLQTEKFEAVCLDLKWSKPMLVEVLDRRISEMFRRKYTSKAVSHTDLFPEDIAGIPIIDYLLDRTLMRPRDLIEFSNVCLRKCEGEAFISAKSVAESEHVYSRGRLQAICDEWHVQYPHLKIAFGLLRRRKKVFEQKDIHSNDMDELVEAYFREHTVWESSDELSVAFQGVLNEKLKRDQLVAFLIRMFYKLEVVGLKIDPHEPVSWASSDYRELSESEVLNCRKVHIHPMFFRALGIDDSATRIGLDEM